ncbi:hypothetical protein MBLNU457_g2827t1 [Dothideomycetes sp. NU457]
MHLRTLALWSTATTFAAASQHDQLAQHPITTPDRLHLATQTKNIAIIGAGSAGASTAYYLRNYTSHLSLPVNLSITVFERNSYVGGRSTTVDVHDVPSEPVELGASIFVTVNQNLVNAAEAFNLCTSSPDTTVYSQSKARLPALGIYDGSSMVLTMQNPGSWWENAKLLWRYGTAPISTLRLTRATVGTFLQMYEAPVFPFRSLTQVALDLGLVDVTAVTGEEFLEQNGVGGDFGREVVQASTRVNYAQDLNRIHGLETMVCMAAEGAMSVEGGNWRIFESMINASGADLRLETQVGLVKKDDDRKWTLSSTGNDGSMSVETFDEVVLAAPMQYSGISFPIGTPKHKVDKIPYVDLHVTLFTSKHSLSPMAFGLAARELVPQAVLTTLPKDGQGTPPEFQSISLLREVINPHNHQTEYLYKVVSMREPDSTFFGRILGLGDLQADAEIEKRDISWMYRKLWQSYPYEYPRVTFEEIQLDDHFWYTSGIESFISTMETSSLMGMNVARLMTDEWMRHS